MIVGIVLIYDNYVKECDCMKQHFFFHFFFYETCCSTNVYVKNNSSDMNLILLIEVLWFNLSLFVK